MTTYLSEEEYARKVAEIENKDYRDWTEGEWATIEGYYAFLAKTEEEKDIPVCVRCHTKPSETNGFEERFCKCGMVHVVTKRTSRKDENQVVKGFKSE